MPSGSATFSPNCSPSPSRLSGASANSIRRKNVPPSGSVEYWSERTMFAPDSYRKRETLATIPGRSGQEISRRSSETATAHDAWSGAGESSNCVIRRRSSTRPSTSPAVSRSTRSVPNSSTLNEASAVP